MNLERANRIAAELCAPNIPGKQERVARALMALDAANEQDRPPLSVYGMDPKLVDLTPLRGPNGLPVEWVDFREPLVDEWYVNSYSRHISKRHDPNSDTAICGPDKRRIIVREVQRKAPRRWLATECTARPCDKVGPQDVLHIFGVTTHPHELARLDDPKVLAHITGQAKVEFWYLHIETVERIAKSAINTYLAMEASR